jgi:hypothetical protein
MCIFVFSQRHTRHTTNTYAPCRIYTYAYKHTYARTHPRTPTYICIYRYIRARARVCVCVCVCLLVYVLYYIFIYNSVYNTPMYTRARAPTTRTCTHTHRTTPHTEGPVCVRIISFGLPLRIYTHEYSNTLALNVAFARVLHLLS